MSRIHDALRKAEQEKQGKADQTPIDVPSLLAASSVEIPGTIQTPVRVPLPPAPVRSISEVGRIEDLRQRCAQMDWKPNNRTIVFNDDSRAAPAAEQFRTLRSRLYSFREKQTCKRVLVTSSLPMEGKTFIAANLAHAIVLEQERRVLLIDGDLRASRLHVALGVPPAPGLSDYLRGEADEFEITQCSAESNLFFIGGGKPSPNPTELLAGERLKNLLDRMSSIFDWIILDSPPVIPVADTGLLANVCDGVLFVVLAGGTPFDAAKKARAALSEKNLIGVVLNRAEEMGSYYSSYYDHYHGDRKD